MWNWFVWILGLLSLFVGGGCVVPTRVTDANALEQAGTRMIANTASVVHGLVKSDAKLLGMESRISGEVINPGKDYYAGWLYHYGSRYTGVAGRVSLDVEGTGGRIQDDLREMCERIIDNPNVPYARQKWCLERLLGEDTQHSKGADDDQGGPRPSVSP